MIFGSYNSRYNHPKTEYAWLSRDEAAVQAYIQDPLCGFSFTASAYLDLLSLQYYCNTRLWYKTLPKDLPLLLISGSMDPVGNYGKGIQAIERQLRGAGIQDLTVWIYPQARATSSQRAQPRRGHARRPSPGLPAASKIAFSAPQNPLCGAFILGKSSSL